MRKQDTAIHRISLYFTSIAFRQLSNILVNILKPKLLSPELFGLYSLLKTATGYASFTPLGARQAVRMQVPMMQSRGKSDTVAAIQSALFYGTLFPNILFVFIIGLVSLPRIRTPQEYSALLTLAALSGCNWYYEYLMTTLKAHQRFEVISKSNYYAVVFSYCSLVMLYVFGIYGLFVSMVLAHIASCLVLRQGAPEVKLPRFRFGLYIELIRYGFPIMSLGLAVLSIRTMDRFIIAGMLGLKDVGFYSIAGMALNFLMNLPTVSREVIEPMLMESIYTMTEQERYTTYLFRPLFHYVYLFPFVVASSFFLSPLLLPLILPEYGASILPTQCLIAGSFFLGLCYVVRGIVVAENLQFKALGMAFFAVIANGIASPLAILAGLGITGVGLMSSLSFGLLLWGLMHTVRKAASCNCEAFNRFWAAFWQCVIPMVTVFATAVILERGGYNTWKVYLSAYGIYCLLAYGLLSRAVRLHPELDGLTITRLFKNIF